MHSRKYISSFALWLSRLVGFTLTVKLTHPCSERRLGTCKYLEKPLCDVQVYDVWSDNLLSFLGPASEDAKLALFDTFVYPIEPHVHGLGLLLAEFLSCDAYRS